MWHTNIFTRNKQPDVEDFRLSAEKWQCRASKKPGDEEKGEQCGRENPSNKSTCSSCGAQNFNPVERKPTQWINTQSNSTPDELNLSFEAQPKPVVNSFKKAARDDGSVGSVPMTLKKEHTTG